MSMSKGDLERADAEVARAIRTLQVCTQRRESTAADHRRACEAEAEAEQRYEQARAKAQAMRAKAVA
jgi:hypothetical protein